MRATRLMRAGNQGNKTKKKFPMLLVPLHCAALHAISATCRTLFTQKGAVYH